jgi:UDP-N-acetylglucosamine acyltransferase
MSGLNIVGLKRRGFEREAIHDLRHAYRLIFAPKGTLQDRITHLAKDFASDAVVMEIVNFIQTESVRSICQPQAERAR